MVRWCQMALPLTPSVTDRSISVVASADRTGSQAHEEQVPINKKSPMPCAAATAAVAAVATSKRGPALSPVAAKFTDKLEAAFRAREEAEDLQLQQTDNVLLGTPPALRVRTPSPVKIEDDDVMEPEKQKGACGRFRAWIIYLFVGHPVGTSTQFVVYCAFVATFQLLVGTLRTTEEFFFDKMIGDTFITNHFDSGLNEFGNIRRTADLYEWGNQVLWPGLFSNAGPCADDIGADDAHGAGSAALRVKGCNDDTWTDGSGSFFLTGAKGWTGIIRPSTSRSLAPHYALTHLLASIAHCACSSARAPCSQSRSR